MRLTDKLSLVGLVMIIGLLLYAARNGPLTPVLRAADLKADPAAVRVVEDAEDTRQPAPAIADADNPHPAGERPAEASVSLAVDPHE